jgi:hypothetical protein
MSNGRAPVETTSSREIFGYAYVFTFHRTAQGGPRRSDTEKRGKLTLKPLKLLGHNRHLNCVAANHVRPAQGSDLVGALEFQEAASAILERPALRIHVQVRKSRARPQAPIRSVLKRN